MCILLTFLKSSAKNVSHLRIRLKLTQTFHTSHCRNSTDEYCICIDLLKFQLPLRRWNLLEILQLCVDAGNTITVVFTFTKSRLLQFTLKTMPKNSHDKYKLLNCCTVGCKNTEISAKWTRVQCSLLAQMPVVLVILFLLSRLYPCYHKHR